jgi:hypothetical protein
MYKLPVDRKAQEKSERERLLTSGARNPFDDEDEPDHVGLDIGESSNADDRRRRLLEGMTNEEFHEHHQQQQQRMLHQQDHDLDALHTSIQRLSQVGHQINTELTTQSRMLDDLHADMDSTGARLRRTMRSAADVLKKSKDKGMICTIVVLTIVCVTLLFVLFNM